MWQRKLNRGASQGCRFGDCNSLNPAPNLTKGDSMRRKDTTLYKGLGVVTFLAIIFAALKLLGINNLSWWWVASPFLVSLSLISLFMFVCALIVLFSPRFN